MIELSDSEKTFLVGKENEFFKITRTTFTISHYILFQKGDIFDNLKKDLKRMNKIVRIIYENN